MAGSSNWAFWLRKRKGGGMKTGRTKGRKEENIEEDRKVGEGHVGDIQR